MNRDIGFHPAAAPFVSDFLIFPPVSSANTFYYRMDLLLWCEADRWSGEVAISSCEADRTLRNNKDKHRY
jgi:hypothetical protein